MRVNTIEMMKKIQTLLTEKEYLSAKEIAEYCNLHIGAVYRIIRMMRSEGIGTHVTTKGYILSEFAKKTDDVGFFRRLNGRRISDYIALQAAAPHIKKRWRGVEDKRNIGIIMGPLEADMKLLDEGISSIKALEEKQGLQ
jgi:hypothetical protein